MTSDPWKRLWLVQRLSAPARPNPFSFGGGLRNGGLSDDAMSLLGAAFSFDYMGSAEFEFGAVPKAFQKMAARAVDETLGSWMVTVPLSEVTHFNLRGRDGKTPKGEGDATIYVIGSLDLEHTSQINASILSMARNEVDLKESTRLPQALRPTNEWDADTKGWLELDNGFMFFTDKEMWKNTCDIFEIFAEERLVE